MAHQHARRDGVLRGHELAVLQHLRLRPFGQMFRDRLVEREPAFVEQRQRSRRRPPACSCFAGGKLRPLASACRPRGPESHTPRSSRPCRCGQSWRPRPRHSAAATCRCISTSIFASTSGFNPAAFASSPCARGLKFSAGGSCAPAVVQVSRPRRTADRMSPGFLRPVGRRRCGVRRPAHSRQAVGDPAQIPAGPCWPLPLACNPTSKGPRLLHRHDSVAFLSSILKSRSPGTSSGVSFPSPFLSHCLKRCSGETCGRGLLGLRQGQGRKTRKCSRSAA